MFPSSCADLFVVALRKTDSQSLGVVNSAMSVLIIKYDIKGPKNTSLEQLSNFNKRSHDFLFNFILM